MPRKRYRWEHDSYDLVFRAQDDKNGCNIGDLQSVWHANKSLPSDTVVARFLKLNKKAFDFLGITPLEPDNNKLQFRTSNYTGCIPLFSPVTGKVYANLIVNGRFDEEVGEILPILPEALTIEYHDELILPHQTQARPPVFYECIRFIEKYLIARRTHWRKFINEQRIQGFPTASTDWGKYAETSYSPDNVFRYPNKVNLLTTNHKEWQQLNYVLKLCANELQSSHVPRKTRLAYNERINYILSILTTQTAFPTNELRIHAADPVIIKELKTIGNRILESSSTEYHAWRVDFNKLFELYVQHIMGRVSLSQHSKSYNNIIFGISGKTTSWTLSHLEPDIVIKKDDSLVIIDAKYKTHMLNRQSGDVSSLHDAFRHDLHQVLAYSSFDPTSHKITLLVYPYTKFYYIKQVISAPLSNITNHVYLVGIPFGKLSTGEDSSVLSMEESVIRATKGINDILDSEFSSSV